MWRPEEALVGVRALSSSGSQPGREMATHASLTELAGMAPKESSKYFQCSSAPFTNSSGKDVPRWWHKRKSRRHQRFMMHKALLEKRGVLGTPPESEGTLHLARSEVLEETERTKYNVHPATLGSPGTQPRKKPIQKIESSKGTTSGHAVPNKCVAIDCEMVGTGPGGRVSELARCSVVSYHGDVLYDKYIRPETPIVDYRTRWSGITRQHMKNAIPFRVAQKEVGRHGHSSVEDATTAMELYRLVEVQWERKEASSHPSNCEESPQDSGTDTEHYMEDQFWLEEQTEG
ncbi:apoptosis-enhancing nuclease isoform X5 [Sarcophilus harrisii]|uniref:apoptosis-enhancing nuclease isoform X5 n=1 Tax=Sarcophilus harrisii TaxID=9305 RepID=UPI001301E142|nr:apoptosis-enhancing nuclease isoform X5 [Sarcophilus harrisii]